MVEVGDKVLVTKPELNLWGDVFRVKDTMIDDQYAKYYGDDCIIVEDDEGIEIAVKKAEYMVENTLSKDHTTDSNSESIKTSDWITLGCQVDGAEKLFYPVVETDGDYIYFYNDNDKRTKIREENVSKVDLNNSVEYINNLQQQVYDLRKVVREMGNLISDDIKGSLRKLD